VGTAIAVLMEAQNSGAVFRVDDNLAGTKLTERIVISPLLCLARDLTEAAKAPKIDLNMAPLGDFASAEKLLRGFLLPLLRQGFPARRRTHSRQIQAQMR
jgi:hypothetical protein